jgi:hypothetical protein
MVFTHLVGSLYRSMNSLELDAFQALVLSRAMSVDEERGRVGARTFDLLGTLRLWKRVIVILLL